MKNEKVRCWKVGQDNNLFITYPEGDMGHRLICCRSCGKVYAVNVAKPLYIELNKAIRKILWSKRNGYSRMIWRPACCRQANSSSSDVP